MKMKKGFTLIELIMVIAILGIISTLAVSRIGNIRERAQRQVSLTNQTLIGKAIESFMTMNGNRGIDRLDSLIDQEVGRGASNGFDVYGTSFANQGAGFYLGPDDLGYPLEQSVSDRNSGLTPNLVNVVLIPYSLNEKEVKTLSNYGVRFVMRHTTRALLSPRAAYGERGEDGAYLSDDKDIGYIPNDSACVATMITNGLYCAAVSPFTPAGREIYRECGQLLLATKETSDEYKADKDNVLAEVKATGGALLAFGLGNEATIIGSAKAGLESAPYASYPLKKFYSRYIVLFRVNTSTESGRLEFAGVIDPCGNTVKKARKHLD
jgi:prepilin-type N-terminal cleavage/methylation domain-containing protein